MSFKRAWTGRYCRHAVVELSQAAQPAANRAQRGAWRRCGGAFRARDDRRCVVVHQPTVFGTPIDITLSELAGNLLPRRRRNERCAAPDGEERAGLALLVRRLG